MMSPMALRRTISRLSTRGASAVKMESVILVATRAAIPTASRFSRPQPRADNLCSRVILWITDNHDSPSTGFDLVALGDTLHRVVGALGVKVRTDFANNCAHVLFRKNNDSVHVGQRRQYFRAFFCRHDGTPLALQRAHRSIAVDCDNQFATKFPSSVQIAYMADMQHIETPVSQRDAITGMPPTRYTPLQFVARNNLRMK